MIRSLTTFLALTICLASPWVLLKAQGQSCSCTAPEIGWYLDVDADGAGAGTCICSQTAPHSGYVNNNSDACPEDGFKQAAGYCGCGFEETDTDDDGEPDCKDPCPYNGSLKSTSTDAVDSDNDGVYDCMDECPNNVSLQVQTPECGCMQDTGDSDGDAIPDCQDICPTDETNTCSAANIVLGCLDVLACNYYEDANSDSGVCFYPTNCKDCIDTSGNTYLPYTPGASKDGTGEVHEGVGAACGCDVDGNKLYFDKLEVCGGDCEADEDNDGICDDEDRCLQLVDNGSGTNVPCSLDNPNCPRLDECSICRTPANSVAAEGNFRVYRKLIQYVADSDASPCEPNWINSALESCLPGEPGCYNDNSSCNPRIRYWDETGDTDVECSTTSAGCTPRNEPCTDINTVGCYWNSGCRKVAYADANGKKCVPGTSGCIAGTADAACVVVTINGNEAKCKPGELGCQNEDGHCSCRTVMNAQNVQSTVAPKVFNECLTCDGADLLEGMNCSNECLDLDNDNVCDHQEVEGCTDPAYCSYDPLATESASQLCYNRDMCGNCNGSDVFKSDWTTGGAPDCVPTGGIKINGDVCSDPLNNADCYPVFAADSNCRLEDGRCDCLGTLPAEGYNCAGACIQDLDQDGTCDPEEVFGCSDDTACNYDANAGVTEELMVDPLGAACSYTYQNNGVDCNPADCTDPENCDCVKVYATNCVSICAVDDVLNVCGGECAADNDNDLVCDYTDDGTLIDPCVGTLDDCGICNGSATGYTRTSFVGGCTPGTFLDSNGNNCRPGTSGCHACTMSVELDAAGTPIVPNYRDSNDKPCNPTSSDCNDSNDYSDATTVSDACNCYGERYDALGNCGGNCEVDADNDNICDRLFDGTEVDEDPNSVCEGTFDAVGECNGTCQTDADQDQLCDDLVNGVSVDQCLDDPANVQDICGICDGPGYPAGFCDCAGVSTTDALDVCGGNCLSDYDEDNICDETMEGDTPDPCVGQKDICGVCGGESSIYTRNGNECIPGTFTDADGHTCTPGTEGCVGCTLTLHRDASGVPCPPVYVNTLGEDCYPGQEGCTATYPNCTEFLSCDCWGHEYDVQGNCNGGCASDSDGDGICDYTVSGIQLDLCISETGLDAIGVCDGNCLEDEDGDGICDLDADGNVDDTCSGILDVCDVCNGTGPDFGYDCDGLCLSDVNNNDICDALEMMIVEESLEFLPSGGNSNATLDHVKVNTAFDKFTYLHEQMADNLSAGSLNGVSPKVTLEQSITSHGDLEVLGLSTFDDNIQVAGNLTVSGSVNVSGNATVGGVTHSNNGLQADNIDNLGYFQADGNVTFNDEISVYGATTLKNITHARKQLQVFEENTSANSLSTGLLFSVSPTLGSTTLLTGKLHSEGNLYANEEAQFTNGLHVRGLSVFESVQAENLNVTGATTMTGDLRVQTDKFKVNHSSGNANLNSRMVVQGNMTAHTLKGLQNFEILGTTVARTGVETPSMIARGNLIVGEKSTLGMNLHVSGSSQFKNELHLEGPFTQYNTQPGANLYGYNGDDTSLDATCAPVYTSGEGYLCDINASPGEALYYADCAIEYPSHCRVMTWGAYSGPSQFSISNSGDINLAGNLKPLSTITARDFSFLATLTNPNAIQISAPSFKLGSLIAASNSTLAGTTNNFTGGIQAGTVTSSGNIVLSGTTSAGLTHEMGIVNVSNHYNLRKTILYGSQSGGTHAVDVKTTASPFVAQFINNATSNQAQTNSGSPSSNIGGVRIKLKGPYNQGGNLDKYVVFKNSANVMTGRINIETREQRIDDNNDYNLAKLDRDLSLAGGTWNVVHGVANLGVSIVGGVVAAIRLAKFSGFTSTCIGNGVCQTIPIISFIVSAAAQLIIAAADITAASYDLVPAGMGLHDAIVNGQMVDGYWVDGHERLNEGGGEYFPMIDISGTKLGVAYESGGADFAEWMPRQKGLDSFLPGSIVGWHEDGLSNNTVDAIQSFAISTLPIVLGNAPKDSKKENYEKVALMGQTPIYVAGFVESGDFIVPAGDNKGYGIAKGPDEITRLDFKEIVGVAWESKSSSGISKINCAVGLNNNELHKKFDEIELETRFLKEQSEALKEVLLAISSGNEQEIGENLLMRAGLQSPELRFSVPTADDLKVAQYDVGKKWPNQISLNLEEGNAYTPAEISIEIIEDQFNVLNEYVNSNNANGSFAKNLKMIEENPELKDILIKSVHQSIQSAQEIAESRYNNRSL